MYKKLLALFSGTLFAQLIGIAAYPLITRLFDAEVLGMLTLVTSISTVLGNVAAFSLPLAIVISKSEVEANVAAKTAFTSTLVTISALYLFFFLIINTNWFQSIFDTIDNSFIFAIFILSSQLSFELTFVQLLLRKYKYRQISKVRIIFSFILNTIKILSFYISQNIHVLVWVSMICGFIKLYLFYRVTGVSDALVFYNVSFKDIKEVVNKHKELVIYRTSQTFINSFSQFMPVLFLSRFYSIMEVGYFGLAKTLLELPINLIGNTISSGLYPYYSELKSQNKSVIPLTFKCITVLLILSSLVSMFLLIFGQAVFAYIFSSDWKVAGEYASVLSVGYITLLCSRTVLPLINVFNLEKMIFKYELFGLVLRLSSLCIPIYLSMNAIDVILYYSISNFFVYLVLIILVLRSVKIKERSEFYD
ncbi:oligosaccharide flippase family protein [Vibrio renipiscarius]|uniref:Polysaccharide biosynthesis protein n=1 Tax=Vibrio renipiscarius TaxID=1461322 RepID=A0A0C2NMJ6_9VIBR|nr:oligosaccharide flippase family protein [Vibrio renipiscarius]KII75257.1 hypothetical protein OJ16_19480 [Vibrio renipiscarius]KII81576.1 hypothetical protein PL18_03130 [Vibrio renipiscarius]